MATSFSKNNTLFIGVIGGGKAPAAALKLAEEVGREIARRGAVPICGGLGGVMEAACKSASEAGGLTVGILPGDDRRSANPYVNIPIVTGIGTSRNAIVVRTAQAVIAIDGSYGTLTEIGFALQDGKPVISLGTWSLSIGGKKEKNIIPAKNAGEAVDKAIKLITGNK